MSTIRSEQGTTSVTEGKDLNFDGSSANTQSDEFSIIQNNIFHLSQGHPENMIGESGTLDELLAGFTHWHKILEGKDQKQARLLDELIDHPSQQNIPEAFGVMANLSSLIADTNATLNKEDLSYFNRLFLTSCLKSIEDEAKDVVTELYAKYSGLAQDLGDQLDSQFHLSPQIRKLVNGTTLTAVAMAGVPALLHDLPSFNLDSQNFLAPDSANLIPNGANFLVPFDNHQLNFPPQTHPTHAPEFQVQPGGEGESEPVITLTPSGESANVRQEMSVASANVASITNRNPGLTEFLVDGGSPDESWYFTTVAGVSGWVRADVANSSVPEIPSITKALYFELEAVTDPQGQKLFTSEDYPLIANDMDSLYQLGLPREVGNNLSLVSTDGNTLLLRLDQRVESNEPGSVIVLTLDGSREPFFLGPAQILGAPNGEFGLLDPANGLLSLYLDGNLAGIFDLNSYIGQASLNRNVDIKASLKDLREFSATLPQGTDLGVEMIQGNPVLTMKVNGTAIGLFNSETGSWGVHPDLADVVTQEELAAMLASGDFSSLADRLNPNMAVFRQVLDSLNPGVMMSKTDYQAALLNPEASSPSFRGFDPDKIINITGQDSDTTIGLVLSNGMSINFELGDLQVAEGRAFELGDVYSLIAAQLAITAGYSSPEEYADSLGYDRASQIIINFAGQNSLETFGVGGEVYQFGSMTIGVKRQGDTMLLEVLLDKTQIEEYYYTDDSRKRPRTMLNVNLINIMSAVAWINSGSIQPKVQNWLDEMFSNNFQDYMSDLPLLKYLLDSVDSDSPNAPWSLSSWDN